MEALPLERIDSPALFLAGGKSHYVPAEDHLSIRELVANVQFSLIENAGHWLHAEDPQAFIQHCLDYFNS
jgi:pimeloyl-ACP methyl ester carboxylesterase